MGFIKKIFGAIFGLISSLLKVVGVGKKSEYFLEIDESQANRASKQAEPAENQAQPAKTEEVASQPASAAIATATESQNGSQPSPQPAAPANAQANAQATADQNEPIAVLSKNGATPQPMPVAAATASKSDTTFAPEYLNPAKNQTRRRRPGANMGSFMSMAKNVKVSGS